MKLETFFEKFDHFTDAPNAVAKMRELILQLAAHGKLVEQSRDDEPASTLVGRIEKHFEALRSRGQLRGSPVEPLDREELAEIPPSWEWMPLGNVVDYGSSDKTESADIPEDAWLLDLEDIEKATSRLLQRKSFRDSPSKSTKTAFAVGDVLYGKLRPYLNKVIVADAPGYCTTEIIPIRAFGFIEPAYLCHALKRPEFIAYANSKSYGMNLPRLGTEDARSAPFPLPPLAEQKRIVAKVNELMALCDRLEAQQQEREARHAALARASLARFADAPTPANLNFLFHKSYAIPPAALRKSILTLAVQGKLVLQDPNDEPAEKALARLEARGGNAKTRRSVPTEVSRPDSLDVENLPESWCLESTARLLQLGAVRDLKDGNHGANHPKVAEFTETGLPFITAAQVSDGGQIDYDGAYKVSGEALKRLRVGFAKPNDVIYTHKGSVGRVAICDRECVLTPQTTYYRVNEEVLSSGFVRTYLLSPLFRDQVDLVKRQTTRDFVSINAQYQFFLRVPPLAEQRRIVAKVEQLMALVDQLETQLAASHATGEKLMQALVAELTRCG